MEKVEENHSPVLLPRQNHEQIEDNEENVKKESKHTIICSKQCNVLTEITKSDTKWISIFLINNGLNLQIHYLIMKI